MDHANIVDLRGLAGSSTLAVFARMPAKHGNLQVPTPQQDRQRERGPSIDGSTKEHHRGRMGSPVRLELPRRREMYEEGVATVLCPLFPSVVGCLYICLLRSQPCLSSSPSIFLEPPPPILA